MEMRLRMSFVLGRVLSLIQIYSILINLPVDKYMFILNTERSSHEPCQEPDTTGRAAGAVHHFIQTYQRQRRFSALSDAETQKPCSLRCFRTRR